MKNSVSRLAIMAVSGLAFSGFAHALSGKVTDDSGKPISGVVIEVVGSQLQAFTDEQGIFQLDTQITSPIELHIDAKGYSHQTMLLNATATESLAITLR